MKRRSLITIILILFAFAVTACGSAAPAATERATDEAPARLQVAATFDAIAEFVTAVGGDRVVVERLVPDGASAHHFEPKARDLLALQTASALFINGLSMEPWVDDAVASLDRNDLKVIDTSQGIDLIEAGEHEHSHEGDDHDHEADHSHEADDHDHEHDHSHEADDHDHEHDHSHKADDHDHEADHDHDHGAHDPHIWLGLSSARKQVENIRDTLIELDPAGADTYRANAAAFIGELDSLHGEYREKFAALSKREFVTGHEAFGYLCRDLGLKQNSVQNLFAEGEPSPRQLAALVDYCRQHDVKTIFSEVSANADVAKTLASEVGADVKLIYTMEQAEAGLSYLERVKANLSAIYDALNVG